MRHTQSRILPAVSLDNMLAAPIVLERMAKRVAAEVMGVAWASREKGQDCHFRVEVTMGKPKEEGE